MAQPSWCPVMRKVSICLQPSPLDIAVQEHPGLLSGRGVLLTYAGDSDEGGDLGDAKLVLHTAGVHALIDLL